MVEIVCQPERNNILGVIVLNQVIGGIQTTAKAVVLLLLMLLTVFIWSNLRHPLEVERLATSQVVVDASGRPLSVKLDGQGHWRYPVALSSISPLLQQAVIETQDRFFYHHLGVGPWSLLCTSVMAIFTDTQWCGETLTVATARLLYPEEGHWWHAIRALQLEWGYSKSEILALYLNRIHLAPKLQGVEAASYQFFNKPSLQLSVSELALLMAVAKAPERYRLDRYAERAQGERNLVIEKLQQLGIITAQQAKLAHQTPVTSVSLDIPQLGHQYAALVLEKSADAVIHTTIDPLIQDELERYAQGFADIQVNGSSMAMVMVDNADKQIRAYVGNSPGHDTTDMIQAIRSPGDMLKPMLFAQALDSRLIHSESLLADVPRHGYLRDMGEGLDEFIGPVSASEALQRSLNVPFIKLLENLGTKKFLDSLASVGQPLELSDFGISPRLLLGEAETNLQQMVELYMALGSDGHVMPIRLLPSDPLEAE
ncbi:MAG: transglycosylase domain-containing protein, partial [Ferrimonas sp.]